MGFSELGLLRLLTALFALMGKPGGILFSAVPHQVSEDSCGQSVILGISGRYPDISGSLSLLDMESALALAGIRSRPVQTSFEEILPLAARNYPIILLFSKPYSHYALAIGEREGMLVIADPSRGTVVVEMERLKPRYSGWSIIPLVEDAALTGTAQRMQSAAEFALKRQAFITKSLSLEITETLPSSPAVRIALGQSISLGQRVVFRVGIGSSPLARLELAAAVPWAGASLEAGCGVLIEKAGSGPKPYARLEGDLIRDPFAFYAGIELSERLDSRVGILYAVNDMAAFEAGLSGELKLGDDLSWGINLIGGVRLAVGKAFLTFRASSPLSEKRTCLLIALDFQ